MRSFRSFSVSYENLLKRSHLRVKEAMKLIKSERKKKKKSNLMMYKMKKKEKLQTLTVSLSGLCALEFQYGYGSCHLWPILCTQVVSKLGHWQRFASYRIINKHYHHMRQCILETTWLRNGTIKLHCRAPFVLSAIFSAWIQLGHH